MPRGVGQDTREGLEEKLRELLILEGKTIVVVDEIPDPVEGGIPDEFTVRKDTAVVLGIAVIVALGVAFLAGRATVRSKVVENPPVVETAQTEKPALPKGVFDPRERVVQPQFNTQPAPNNTIPAAPQIQPEQPQPQPAAPQRQAVKRKYYLAVTTTSVEKGQDVVTYFNTDPSSPIAQRPDLCAYLSGRQVRIRGFKDKETQLIPTIKTMRDPTGGGGRLGCGTFIRDR